MPSASGWQRWASWRGGGDPCFVTDDPLLDTAKADLLTAYNNAFAQTPDTGFIAGDNHLGGQTLTAGVYRFPAATTANLIGTLTLDGDPNAVWVFQATSSLVTAAGSQALLTGAAQACNVFWQVRSDTTLNTTIDFVGTILGANSIFLLTGATINGRALALAGAVTMDQNTINAPECQVPTTTTTTTTTSTTTTTQPPGSTSTTIVGIPAAENWGMMILGLAFLGAMAWMVRARRSLR